jgi:peroxiredoxin
MARTPSNMIPLGTPAPDFDLFDVVSGESRSYDDIAGSSGTLIMFICNHCPFVKHIEDQLIKLSNEYMIQGIGIAGISSNDVDKYPDDAPEKMKELAEEKGYPFSYLYDESQEVAKAYDAACTPDFYLFDSEKKLVYRGQLDDSRPGADIPVTGKDLRMALDAVVHGETPDMDQKPSLGCNIKWK